MTGLNTVRAVLEPRHLELAARVDEMCERLIRPLPEPESDDEGRTQAREVLAWMGAHDTFRPIADLDLRALCVVRDGVGAASPLADAVVALQGLSITPLLLADNPAMREAWVEPALQGAAMGAFAMTEPEAGSDVGSLRTLAVRDGDEYVLDGTKAFISNAGIADFHVVFASTDPGQGRRGLSCFVVGAATE